jgi:hypothetical protein
VRICDHAPFDPAVRGEGRLRHQAGAREEHDVAGRNRPSFLKKQKEEQRRARAASKREARRARKQAADAKGAAAETPAETGETAPVDEGEEPGAP